MIVVRWILGVIALLLSVGALFGLALFIGFESQLWLQRARRLRGWLWLLALFWFNLEIWGRVAYTLWHWNG